MDLPGPGMAPHLWHGHEMIFGYGAAAVAGFLLTSLAGARAGGYIGLAVALWIAGRMVVWASGALPGLLVAGGVDLAFLPLLAGRVALILARRRNPQQAVFLIFLTAMTVGNLLVHLDWLGWGGNRSEDGLRIGLLALIGLIAVLGGRVTPGFIRNALRRAAGGIRRRTSDCLRRPPRAWIAPPLPWPACCPSAPPGRAWPLALPWPWRCHTARV